MHKILISRDQCTLVALYNGISTAFAIYLPVVCKAPV